MLDDGTTIRARAVVSGVNPKLLYTRLIPADALAARLSRTHAALALRLGTFRMNVALSALPRFTALPDAGDHHTAGIILAPSLAYMDRAYHDARESAGAGSRSSRC